MPPTNGWSSGEPAKGFNHINRVALLLKRPISLSSKDSLLGRSIEDGVNLPELMDRLAQHYLKKAVDESNGNKTKAALLVGLPSYQTFTNWMKKHKVA